MKPQEEDCRAEKKVVASRTSDTRKLKTSVFTRPLRDAGDAQVSVKCLGTVQLFRIGVGNKWHWPELLWIRNASWAVRQCHSD
ncbi:rCG44109 [Rattus norvegicus]|uniref:RCG44109 n=1 Tax=Rattus norvegicus TaxID=10116 RepID=A6J778_RAT|nr:rCG44109 [Rattus norvegicus]